MNDDNSSKLEASCADLENSNPVFDSLDVSLDMKEDIHRSANMSDKKSRPVIPQLASFRPDPQKLPPVGLVSPADSNLPTYGDIKSPKEEDVRPNGGFRIPIPASNQAQDFRNRIDRPQSQQDGENNLFSFRRERELRDQIIGSRQPSTHPSNNASMINERRDDFLDINPLSERDGYDKTRQCFARMKKFYIHYVLNVLCLGLIAFNFSVAYATEGIRFTMIEQIDEQFRQKVVLDIDLMPKTQTCTFPYSSSSMGTWPGYENACVCKDKTIPGECSAKNVAKGCSNSGPIDAVPLSSWDGRKICLRRSDKSLLDYYESSTFMESYNGNFLCPNGLKKCTVSNNKNFICVGRFDFCPITQIEINNQLLTDKTKYKAQLPFDNKVLVYDNQGNAATTFTDIVAERADCKDKFYGKQEDKDGYCLSSANKTLLDSFPEYQTIKDSLVSATNPEAYSIIQNSDMKMNLYTVPMSYVDMCNFNSTFNPVLLNNQLTNWKGVKFLLFMNPFFMSTLLVINLLRIFIIKYINTNTTDPMVIKRRKEVYNVFGGLFTGSVVVVIMEVVTILYYIFWGYLLLNPDRLIAQKWLSMSCIDANIKTELRFMIDQFTKIETFNMVTIGPMILGCILEALFSQYRLITTPYSQLRNAA